VLWKTRVQLPEQFSFCPNDGGKDCRTAADCATGVCRKKSAFHDFGFLNGPIIAAVDTGGGQTRTLIVSGSKDGTIYALDPADGSYVWKNPVRPTPVTPGFAGFGLFNGADGFADQRFYATADASIFNPPLTEHLYAFDGTDGSIAWQQEIGNSWGSVGLANGLVFAGAGTIGAVNRCSDDEQMFCSGAGDCAAGTCEPLMRCSDDQTKVCTGDPDCAPATCIPVGPFFVYDGSTGERLRQFILPANVASGASIVDGNVYVGYGIFGALGGVVALGLPSCLGDCNNDHKVAIDELVRGVDIGLGRDPMGECPRFDADSSGDLSVDELVGGVGNSIAGCD
jgi:outer membrane protein assembly factor BamB